MNTTLGGNKGESNRSLGIAQSMDFLKWARGAPYVRCFFGEH